MTESEQYDLIQYFRILKVSRKKIFIIVGIVTLFTAIGLLFVKNTYQAEVTLLPTSVSKGGGGLAALTSQLSSLPLPIMMGSQQGGQLLVFLQSKTLAERVIEKMDLQKVLFKDEWSAEKGEWKGHVPTMQQGVEALLGMVKPAEDKKTNLITLMVQTNSPELSAKIANAYVDQLKEYINENAFTNAKRSRLFIEEQLLKSKESLLNAGKELNLLYKTGKISSIESNLDIPIDELTMTLRGSGAYANADNLAQMYGELKSLPGNKGVRVIENVPQQVYLQYMVLKKELLAKVYALLTQQYEMAKIDEAKEELSFQVVDPANPPLRKIKPKRTIIVMTMMVMSLVVTCTVTILMHKPKGHKS